MTLLDLKSIIHNDVSTSEKVHLLTWMMRRLPQDNGASALTTHQLQVESKESHRAKEIEAQWICCEVEDSGNLRLIYKGNDIDRSMNILSLSGATFWIS